MARTRRTARRRPSSGAATAPAAKPDAVSIGAGGWIVAGAIGATVAALYLRTAAQDIVLGDSPELVGVAAVLGVAHPPGYPVWTIVAHLFTLLPIGTLPFRVSLFSVVAAVACVVLVYLTALRLSRNLVASAAAALALALVPAFWAWSVVPEVFALADALAAGLLYLVLLWHQEERPAYFIAAAFLGGLGMAHQQTIALLAPAILYLMWHHRKRFDARLLARATLAFGVGLLPYLYLPIGAARHTAWNFAELASVGDVIGHILRSGYGTGALVSVPQFQGGSVIERLAVFATSFTVVGPVLAAIGVASLYRRDRAWLWTSAIAFAVSGPLFIAYTNINLAFPVLHAVIERFFLLPEVVLAPLAAVGIVAIADAARVPALMRAAPIALSALAVAVAAGIAFSRFAAIDESDDRLARAFGMDILDSTRQGALLLAAGDAVVGPVGYLQTIEGVRTDVTFIQMPLLYGDWYIRQLRREYPTLKLNFDRLDGLRGTLRALVDANGFDRFDIMGSLIDDSLAQPYALYRRGLVEELRQKPATVDLESFVALNDKALRGYRITTPDVPPRPWDRLILTDYALAASDIGDVLQRSKRNADARAWYERALAMYPDLAEAKAGLATLPP